MRQALASFWHWLSGGLRFERTARLIAMDKAHAIALAEHIDTDLERVMWSAENFYHFMMHGTRLDSPTDAGGIK